MAIDWTEIYPKPEARVDIGATQIEFAWLTEYLVPIIVIAYIDKKILAGFKAIRRNEFGTVWISINSGKLPANVTLEMNSQIWW